MRANHFLLSLVRPTLFSLFLINASVALGQSPSFTYQGRLNDAGAPASGSYDLEFRLFDVQSGGTALTTQQRLNVAVSTGVFTVTLDFGSSFTGGPRFLEIGVRPPGGASFTTLGPRQPITSTPYAIRSLNAGTADTATNATQLGGVAAGQYVLTSDSRLTDARPPTAGSSNYIQNTTTQQAASNFNISGNGIISGRLAVGISDPGNRFSVSDSTDFPSARFVNNGSGPALSGQGSTTTGITSGTIGGNEAGVLGIGNSGVLGRTFGTGNPTTAIGVLGDAYSSTGNTVGVWGQTNSSSGTGVFGWATNVSGGVGVDGRSDSSSGIAVRGIQFSTGTAVLGSSTNGRAIRGISSGGYAGYFDGKVYFDGNTGFGVLNPTERVHVSGNGIFSGALTVGGNGAGLYLRSGFDGQTGPIEAIRIQGPNSPADANSAQDISWSFASAGSAKFRSYRGSGWDTYLQFLTNDYGRGSDAPQVRMHIDHGGNVGIGTTTPASKLQVVGQGRFSTVSIDSYVAGQNLALCTTNAGPNQNIVGLCSSSLRYKTNVHAFTDGLNIVNRLRPITFMWKHSALLDVGLAAEEVNKIEPLLTLRNEKGEIEGVKYNQMSAVLINAIKEQQQQIEQMRAANAKLNARLQTLEKTLRSKRKQRGR